MVEKIRFKNYKIFQDWQTLELKPITILIGKNNSGKSAVAKLPTLISGSLGGKFSMPLRWENEGIRLGLSYEDLVYNRYPANNLEFEISSEKEKIAVSIYADRNGKLNFSNYKYFSNEVETKIESEEYAGFIKGKKKFQSLSLNFDYVGPFRVEPDANYSNDFNEYQKIGKKGENAYPILIQNSDEKLLSKVSSWYKENFEGWGLKVSQSAGITKSYEISLEKSGIQPINLVNVGQGIHQVLPLIVRSYMPVDEPTLIIMEEPDTHIHPSAHGNIAQRFVESHLEDKNKHYLIETHSLNFILRLRRLIAEGILSKDDLAIYYVDFDSENNESSMRKIEIDKNGGIPNKDWPEGIFSETAIETRAIYNAQLNDLQNVD